MPKRIPISLYVPFLLLSCLCHGKELCSVETSSLPWIGVDPLNPRAVIGNSSPVEFHVQQGSFSKVSVVDEKQTGFKPASVRKTGNQFTVTGTFENAGTQEIHLKLSGKRSSLLCKGTAQVTPIVLSPEEPTTVIEDISTSGLVKGYSLDPASPLVATQLHFYVDGGIDSGKFIGTAEAFLDKTDLQEKLLFTGHHGFQFQIPETLPPGEHSLYVYTLSHCGILEKRIVSPARKTLVKIFSLSGQPQTRQTAAIQPPHSEFVSIEKGGVRVTVDPYWGAAIRELSDSSGNFVNANDTSRLIRVELREANSGSHPLDAAVWKVEQGGDSECRGSPVLSLERGKDFIKSRTQPLIFDPRVNGLDMHLPVLSDFYIDQEIFLEEVSDTTVVHLKYDIYYFGKDPWALGRQQLPGIVLNSNFDRATYYGGESPWTNGPLQTVLASGWQTIPGLLKPTMSEPWSGLADSTGRGLTVVFPEGAYSYYVHPLPNTNQNRSPWTLMSPGIQYAFNPQDHLKFEVFLIPGSVEKSRKLAAVLSKRLPRVRAVADAAFGYSTPERDSVVSGETKIAGTAPAHTEIAELFVSLDCHNLENCPIVSKIPIVNGGAFNKIWNSKQAKDGRHVLWFWSNVENHPIFMQSIPICVHNDENSHC